MNIGLDFVKVRIELPDDNMLNSSAETLWAESLGNDLYKLKNSPFWAYGFSFEDVVIAKGEDIPTVETVHSHSGHSTYRVLLEKGVFDSDRFQSAWSKLELLGCTYEGSQSSLLSIDVPAESDIFKVYELLEMGEVTNVWEFEEAKCAHKTEV